MPTREFAFPDVTVHAMIDGPEDGPLALCLHGFPDSWHTFRHLTPRLAALGYRTVVPALRGYAPSSVPADGEYSIAALTHDAVRLYDELGGDHRAIVIGHDWGAAVAYQLLALSPHRFAKGITMAVPPVAQFAAAFGHYDQLRCSWYMFFFQSPLADSVVNANDLDFIRRQWADWSPGYDATEDLGFVRAAIGAPERTTAAIGYYRAMFGGQPVGEAHAAFTTFDAPAVPILYLHGRQDGCLLPRYVEGVEAHLPPGSRFELIDGAGHFLQLEQPETVGRLVASFLAG